MLAFLFVNYIQQYNKQDIGGSTSLCASFTCPAIHMYGTHTNFRRMPFDCAAYKSQLVYVLQLSWDSTTNVSGLKSFDSFQIDNTSDNNNNRIKNKGNSNNWQHRQPQSWVCRVHCQKTARLLDPCESLRLTKVRIRGVEGCVCRKKCAVRLMFVYRYLIRYRTASNINSSNSFSIKWLVIFFQVKFATVLKVYIYNVFI